MFNSDDFELSLEGQLKLRMMSDEIKYCDNVELLKTHLTQMTKLFMHQQQLLHITLAKLLELECQNVNRAVEVADDLLKEMKSLSNEV